MAKLRVVVEKGKELERGVYRWSVWIVASTGARLPAGSVDAREKHTAQEKGEAQARELIRKSGGSL